MAAALLLGGTCAGAADPAASDVALISDETLAFMLLLHAQCVAVVPEYGPQATETYATWRKRHAEAVERTEGTSEYRRSAAQIRDATAAAASSADVYRQLCLEHVLPVLSETPVQRDPRLATPATTWHTFTDALRRADRGAAKACLVGPAAAHVGASIDRMTDAQLAQMGESFTQFSVTLDLGDLAEATVVTSGGRGGAVHFERAPVGWKIGDL